MDAAAAIDVGSNAIRCAIGELTRGGELKVVKTERKAVSLGRSVFMNRDRKIDSQTLERSINALRDIHADIMKAGIPFRAVGTSALRDAENRDELIDAVSKFGLVLEPITGDEEGNLIRRAVQAAVSIGDKRAALLDIGGGSVEFTLLKKGEVLFSVSERVGTIRLLKSLNEHRISTERFSDRVRKVIEALGQNVSASRRDMDVDLFIGTGGNVEELATLRTRVIEGKKKANKIRFRELAAMVEILEPMTPEERQAAFQFRPDRADVILPAAVILREVMERLDIGKVIVPRVGLREGILIEILGASRLKSE